MKPGTAEDKTELQWLERIPPPELPLAVRLARVHTMVYWARAHGAVLRKVRVGVTAYGGIGLFTTRDLPNRLPYNDVSEEDLELCSATVPLAIVLESTASHVNFVNKLNPENPNYALALQVALCAYQGAACQHFPWIRNVVFPFIFRCEIAWNVELRMWWISYLQARA
jgi:hypothetical protein